MGGKKKRDKHEKIRSTSMFDFLLFVACECFRSTELLLQGKQLITIKQNNPLRQAFYFIIFFYL